MASYTESVEIRRAKGAGGGVLRYEISSDDRGMGGIAGFMFTYQVPVAGRAALECPLRYMQEATQIVRQVNGISSVAPVVGLDTAENQFHADYELLTALEGSLR